MQYVRMERQRLLEGRAKCWAPARPRPIGRMQAALAALCLATALLLLQSPLVRAAEGPVVVDGVADNSISADAGAGMSNANPRVRSILAAHPNQFVVICVAGCDGKPRAVQVLPRPVERRVGQFVPSAAKMGKLVPGPQRQGASAGSMAATENDVVCIAGCNSKPGQVLQRISGLPAPPKAAPAVSKDALPRIPDDMKTEGPAPAR